MARHSETVSRGFRGALKRDHGGPACNVPMRMPPRGCPPAQMGEGPRPLALGQQMHRDAVELRRRRAPRLHSYTATCGIADTVKTKFKVEPGDGKHPDDRWYAWLKEEWGCDPGGKDRARLRTRWAGLPIPARRHDSMLRQAKGRTLEHGL